MSKRIDTYGIDDYASHPSEREYDEVGSFTIERRQEYGSGYERETTIVYVDPTTGLLVADIDAYEKWVR